MLFFFFFISCFSCIFFYKSLSLNPLPFWAYEMRLIISPLFWKDLSLLALTKFVKTSLLATFLSIPFKMLFKNKSFTSQVVSVVDDDDVVVDHNRNHNHNRNHGFSKMCLLDLPELVLECILERVPPEGLCNMASVCSSLRERCVSDYLWERHMKQKWGGVIGPAAFREWQWYVNSRKESNFFNQANEQGFMNYLATLWPISVVRSNLSTSVMKKKKNSPRIDSVMSWYLALESGKFWFPAQVYNRENGHVGFMLSCYDAELCYDPKTDTFQARYPPHGRRAVAIEIGVTWDRLRAPPVDTSPYDLHISDCLNELRPGDHIEIQWRRNKEFPYGWWYGIVGHLETCNGNDNYCSCHENESVVLEFNQYTPGSRWRRTTVSRKDHREEGDEADGFYGGIRKIKSKQEISMWKQLWPAEILE